jgi:multiple sugar transport system permease protein
MTPGQWMGRAVAILILMVFVLFFVVPLIWLVLAPTKTDRQLLLEAPFAFGDWETLAANWTSLVTFQKGLIWTWIGNSAFYCVAALCITLIISIPAGYAMALTEFRGRKALLAATLIVMLVPSTALVLPIFLELSAVRLIGNPLAAILPFSFFRSGCTSPTSTFRRRCRATCWMRRGWMGRTSSRCSGRSPCRSPRR